MEEKVAHTLIFLSKTTVFQGTAAGRVGQNKKKEKLESVSFTLCAAGLCAEAMKKRLRGDSETTMRL